MKTGRNLQELLKELERQAEAKRDYISPASSLKLEEDGYTLSMGEQSFGTTGLFHKQMASALNIPVKYYELMQKEKSELLAENVNSWLFDRKQKYMVRTLDGRARALLSDRYRRIDNAEVASAVLPLFAGVAGAEVMSSEVTETKLYLKIVNHRMEAKCVGDTVQAGVVISNSEVGMGAVMIRPLVYTLVCKNGLIVNSLGERKTHIGRSLNGFDGILSDETKAAEDKAFLLKLRDVVKAALDETVFRRVIEELEKAAENPITGHVEEVVELTCREYGMTEWEQEGILKYLISGGELSRYGLSNAVTRASQDTDSYDRATELESIGWNVITMPSQRWREINASDHRY